MNVVESQMLIDQLNLQSFLILWQKRLEDSAKRWELMAEGRFVMGCPLVGFECKNCKGQDPYCNRGKFTIPEETSNDMSHYFRSIKVEEIGDYLCQEV